MHPYKAFALSLLLLTPAAFAEIYKVTDENGKVHFTDTPPESAENIEEMDLDENINQLETGKTQQQVEDEYQTELDASHEARKKAWEKYDRDIYLARKELKAAKKGVEDAKTVRDGDLLATRSPNGTFMRRSDAYKERIKTAEERLENAQKQIKQVLKTRPRLSRP